MSRRRGFVEGSDREGRSCGQLHVALLLSLCLLVPLLVIACASASGTASRSELLFGTWVNKEYVNSMWLCKFTLQPDGKMFEWADGISPDQPNNLEGRFTIEKKWLDSRGNTWYRIAGKGSFVPYSDAKAEKHYSLIKISSAGKVLDDEWSTVDFPSQFGALGSHHFVCNREQ